MGGATSHPTSLGMSVAGSTQSSRRSSRSRHSFSGLLSVEATGALDVPGEGKPRRHPMIASLGPEEFITTYEHGINTLYDSFQRSVRLFGTATIYNGLLTLFLKANVIFWGPEEYKMER